MNCKSNCTTMVYFITFPPCISDFVAECAEYSTSSSLMLSDVSSNEHQMLMIFHHDWCMSITCMMNSSESLQLQNQRFTDIMLNDHCLLADQHRGETTENDSSAEWILQEMWKSIRKVTLSQSSEENNPNTEECVSFWDQNESHLSSMMNMEHFTLVNSISNNWKKS